MAHHAHCRNVSEPSNQVHHVHTYMNRTASRIMFQTVLPMTSFAAPLSKGQAIGALLTTLETMSLGTDLPALISAKDLMGWEPPINPTYPLPLLRSAIHP